MNTIKFSHEYPKLHGQTSAELLAVRPIKIDAHTPKELLDYDTTYEGGRYPLKSGDYIQLIFLGNLRIPFCTIRSAYPASKVMFLAAYEPPLSPRRNFELSWKSSLAALAILMLLATAGDWILNSIFRVEL